jgi:hypothetical protein
MMPDFFTRLAGRTLEALPVVRPAINSMYAPDSARTDENVQTDPDSLFSSRPAEPPSFSVAQETMPSVSSIVPTHATPSLPQIPQAPRGTTEQKRAQPLIGESPNTNSVFRHVETPTDFSSNEDRAANNNRTSATGHRVASHAEDAPAATTNIDAASSDEQHLAGEQGSTENRGIENSDGQRLPEASAQKRLTSLPRLVVKPENVRVQTSVEGSGEQPSSRPAQSPSMRSRDGAAAGRATPTTDAGVASSQSEESPQTIRVSIGRIEVRALMTTPTPTAPRRIAPQPQSSSSLEEYLRSRHGGTKR